MDPKERDRILEQFKKEHRNDRPPRPDRGRRRMFGRREDLRIDSTLEFGGRPTGTGGLEHVARAATRRRRWQIRTVTAVVVSFVPVALAIVMGVLVGAAAACITLVATMVPLCIMVRWVDVGP